MHPEQLSTGAGRRLTREIAEVAASVAYAELPQQAIERVRHCLLDWLAVTIAGAAEPAAAAVRAIGLAESAHGEATIVGTPLRSGPQQAALANAVAAHALDFDDLNMHVVAHLSAPVCAAVVALAQQRRCGDGRTLIEAVVAGVETACRVGLAVGESHYRQGWHATGTLGTFGAAAACGRLLSFDAA